MAAFAGIDLGPTCFVQTRAAPKDLQINAFPGVDGLEILDLGARGGTSQAAGECYADNAADLYATEQQFRGMQAAGTVGVLVDTLGVSWPGVRLVDYEPTGPVIEMPDGSLIRSYRMTFLHAS